MPFDCGRGKFLKLIEYIAMYRTITTNPGFSSVVNDTPNNSKTITIEFGCPINCQSIDVVFCHLLSELTTCPETMQLSVDCRG
ncbi:hypothetical protein DERF_001193 [Dermatophagoides farinae]|uniref:Uncharacterized protein n=1 Tax=Dermatophagoides farinae TaxID=6954 RepID=A0A922L9E5_DERFA|nr:hypothetical protein DERF_001193 [Dermatophagoides farinae]